MTDPKLAASSLDPGKSHWSPGFAWAMQWHSVSKQNNSLRSLTHRSSGRCPSPLQMLHIAEISWANTNYSELRELSFLDSLEAFQEGVGRFMKAEFWNHWTCESWSTRKLADSSAPGTHLCFGLLAAAMQCTNGTFKTLIFIKSSSYPNLF